MLWILVLPLHVRVRLHFCVLFLSWFVISVPTWICVKQLTIFLQSFVSISCIMVQISNVYLQAIRLWNVEIDLLFPIILLVWILKNRHIIIHNKLLAFLNVHFLRIYANSRRSHRDSWLNFYNVLIWCLLSSCNHDWLLYIWLLLWVVEPQ